MRWIGLLAVLGAVVIGVFIFTRGDSDQTSAASVSSTTTAPAGTTEPAPSVTTSEDVSDVAGTYSPRFEEATCQFDEPLGREPECGYLVVPQNRGEPDGRQVRMHVAVFPGESDSPAADPVLYLEGGPGGEALEVLELVFEDRFAPFVEDRDVIIFDQRGTGFSEPSLACGAYRELSFELLDDLLTPAEGLEREYDVLADCRQSFVDDGVDLSQYNSATIAADIEDLRIALGIDEWNLYGISYGTRLALTVMRDHPDGLRSVILDSVYPPEVDGIANIPANADRAFDAFFAGCEADPGCAEAFPNLESRFRDLVGAADATPVAIEVIDFFSGETYDAVLDGGDLVGVIFQSLYSETIIPTIPELIADIEAGDTRDLANIVSLFIANGEFFSVGMHASVQCHEEIPFSDQVATARAAEEYPIMGRVVEGSVTQSPDAQAFCALWDAGTAAPVEAEPVTSDVPTLVMAGDYDPITPPADGQAVAERLERATYVEFPGLGHAVSTAGECPTSIATSFFTDPDTAPDTSCASEMAGPDFGLPGDVVELGALVPFEDGLVAGVAPEAWESLGPGTFARQASGLDQTALIQQAVPGGSSDLVLGLLASQLGLDDPVAFEELEAGDRLWTRYEGELQGFVADIALTDADGLTYLVVLISDADERAQLVEQVLLPVLAEIGPS